MSRTLRAFIVATALLAGMFGASTAFASPNPATVASHAATGSISAPAARAVTAADGTVSPDAQYQCATTFAPPYLTFGYSCVIKSGFVQYVAHCVDQTTVSTGWLPVGTWRGTLTCASTIVYVAKYTED